MREPDFLVCLVCDTPTYLFEYADEKIVSATCSTCGNDERSEFITDLEYEEGSE
jgi:hypothetical protein